MKSILITGSTGFLGRHLVEQLKSAEPEAMLRVLARGKTPWEKDPRVEVSQGDVTRREDLLRAAESAIEIYHLAGLVSRSSKDREVLYRTHIEGTRNVCEAMRLGGVHKAVLVSSSGTIAVGLEPVIHNESSCFTNEVVGEWPYYLSKIFAEKLALDYARRYGLPVVIMNPSLLLGPGDDRRSSTGDIALFLEGQILALPRGGLNFLDVRDAAAGLIAAMHRGRAGERYLLGGVNWTFRELIEHVAVTAGRRAPRLQPPLALSLASARLLRRIYPLAGKAFKLDDASLKMAGLFWYCDSSKARRELGFQTRDPGETLYATVEDLATKPAVKI
ncbi:MAG: NAD-dependent epimerase/dehydratase family protein [Terriglobia bacterium]